MENRKGKGKEETKGKKKKLRVLCLHGYRQSGPIFDKKSLPFRQRCLNTLDIEYVFPTAPNKMDDVSDEDWNKGAPLFHWWASVPLEGYLTTPKVEGLDDTLTFIADFIRNEESAHGPFDGVMGYSQGGVLASLLCIKAHLALHPPQHPIPDDLKLIIDRIPDNKFRFGMFFCAFPIRATPFNRAYEVLNLNVSSDDVVSSSSTLPAAAATPSSEQTAVVDAGERAHLAQTKCIPTLHSWGTKDDLVPPSVCIELADLFGGSVRHEHNNGHVIATNGPAKQAYRAFLNQFLE